MIVALYRVYCFCIGRKERWFYQMDLQALIPYRIWGRGYFVSTVGINEEAVRRYVLNQYHHQVDLTQPKMI